MNKKKPVRIGVLVLIILLIAGVWFAKNRESAEPVIADVPREAAASVPSASGDSAVQGAVEPAIDTGPMAADIGTPIEAQSTEAVGGAAAAHDPNFTLHTEKIDLEVLSAYKLPMIFDFGSDDCIPCKEMAPVLKTLNAEMQGKAIIRFVDVWKHINGAAGFPIQVIPTQVLVTADGKPYVPSEEMQSSGIRFTMYSKRDTNEHVFTVHQGGLTDEQMRLILKDMGVE